MTKLNVETDPEGVKAVEMRIMHRMEKMLANDLGVAGYAKMARDIARVGEALGEAFDTLWEHYHYEAKQNHNAPAVEEIIGDTQTMGNCVPHTVRATHEPNGDFKAVEDSVAAANAARQQTPTTNWVAKVFWDDYRRALVLRQHPEGCDGPLVVLAEHVCTGVNDAYATVQTWWSLFERGGAWHGIEPFDLAPVRAMITGLYDQPKPKPKTLAEDGAWVEPDTTEAVAIANRQPPTGVAAATNMAHELTRALKEDVAPNMELETYGKTLAGLPGGAPCVGVGTVHGAHGRANAGETIMRRYTVPLNTLDSEPREFVFDSNDVECLIDEFDRVGATTDPEHALQLADLLEQPGSGLLLLAALAAPGYTGPHALQLINAWRAICKD